MNWVEYDVATGRICSTGRGGSELPTATNGRAYVEVSDAEMEQLPTAGVYDAKSRTFTAEEAAPSKRLSKADVIGQLTPAQWAEMNRFHPTATGTSPTGVPYSDPDVFWAISVFNAAEKDFSLNDTRLPLIIGRLVEKRVLTADAAQALQASLAAVAR